MLLAAARISWAGSDIDRAIELRGAGKLEAARELLLQAAAGYRSANDRNGLVRALGIAADISLALGEYDAAIEQATETVTGRIALNDHAKLADDYNTIGLANQYKGNYAGA